MTDSITKPARQRRMAREPQAENPAVDPMRGGGTQAGAQANAQTANAAAMATKPPSRLDQLEHLLVQKDGATIAEMMTATGWQQHSVRGAMAGALKKKRSLVITSAKTDGVRRYSAEKPA